VKKGLLVRLPVRKKYGFALESRERREGMNQVPVKVVAKSYFPESRVGPDLRWNNGFSIVTQAVVLLLGLALPVTASAQSPLTELWVPGYPQAFKIEPDVIGVRVKSKVKTMDIQSAKPAPGWTKCASDQGVSLSPSLKYTSLKYREKLTDDEEFATFDVTVNGMKPKLAELLDVAAMVNCENDNVTAAGIVVRSFEDGRAFLLTGFAWGDRSAVVGSHWELIWPDPFAPGSGRYLLKLKADTDPLTAMSTGTVEPILLPTIPSDAEAGFDTWSCHSDLKAPRGTSRPSSG
jgi:hypothetical protein